MREFDHFVSTHRRRDSTVRYSVDQFGKRGFLAFTSATGAKRGSPNCTVSSPGKFAVRGLSQSIAKEFHNDEIHVSLFPLSCICMMNSLMYTVNGVCGIRYPM